MLRLLLPFCARPPSLIPPIDSVPIEPNVANNAKAVSDATFLAFSGKGRETLFSLCEKGPITYICSFLQTDEINCVQRISKEFNRIFHDHLFQPKCLNQKNGALSWESHYAANEALNSQLRKQPYEKLYSFSDITCHNSMRSTLRSIQTDPKTGFICFALGESNGYESNIKSCSILNIKNDKEKIYFSRLEGRFEDMVFGYPHLLTVNGEDIYLRNLTNPSNTPPIKMSFAEDNHRVSHFIVNQYGLAFIKQQGGNLFLGLHTIDKGHISAKGVFFEVSIDYPPLLHDHRLIYFTREGSIMIRDILKDGAPVTGEISLPQEETALVESPLAGEIESPGHVPQKRETTSMIADGQFLAVLSGNYILLCDLQKARVVKKLPRPEGCLNLELLTGHTIFIHTDEEIRALDFNGEALQCWKNVYQDVDKQRFPRCRSVGYYNGKIYVWHVKLVPFQSIKHRLAVYPDRD